jgi:hypothetical protein
MGRLIPVAYLSKVAVSHLSRDECERVLQETKGIDPIYHPICNYNDVNMEIDTSKLYYNADDLTFEDFQRHWKVGLPMVITNLGKRSQIQWTPEYFMKSHTGQACRCVNSNVQGEEILMKVEEFFAGFNDHSLRKFSRDGTTACLKLKVCNTMHAYQVCYSSDNGSQRTAAYHFRTGPLMPISKTSFQICLKTSFVPCPFLSIQLARVR